LRDEAPGEFQRAIEYELEMQAAFSKVPRMTGIPFLHDSRVPLAHVDFRTAEEAGQQSMFGNDCEGMCGV
jgi:hypothetical protein